MASRAFVAISGFDLSGKQARTYGPTIIEDPDTSEGSQTLTGEARH